MIARRVASYDPELLDRLCLSGEVMWGRPVAASGVRVAGLHPVGRRRQPAVPAARCAARPPPAGAANRRSCGRGRPAVRPRRPARSAARLAPRPPRVRPTRVAPVTVFLRADADWLLAAAGRGGAGADDAALSHPAREVRAALSSRGASFLPELVRATGRLPSEVEDGLWELVAAGLVSADGYDNLRALVDPKRRRGEGRGRAARPRHAAGRWALLDTGEPAAPDAGGVTPDGGAGCVGRRGRVRRPRVRRPPRRRLWMPTTRRVAATRSRWPASPGSSWTAGASSAATLAARETLAPPWRDLLRALRRMEARGEIRGRAFRRRRRGGAVRPPRRGRAAARRAPRGRAARPGPGVGRRSPEPHRRCFCPAPGSARCPAGPSSCCPGRAPSRAGLPLPAEPARRDGVTPVARLANDPLGPGIFRPPGSSSPPFDQDP